jgi:hypothetical protein
MQYSIQLLPGELCLVRTGGAIGYAVIHLILHERASLVIVKGAMVHAQSFQ